MLEVCWIHRVIFIEHINDKRINRYSCWLPWGLAAAGLQAAALQLQALLVLMPRILLTLLNYKPVNSSVGSD